MFQVKWMPFIDILRRVLVSPAAHKQSPVLFWAAMGMSLGLAPAWAQVSNVASPPPPASSPASISPLPAVLGSTSFAPKWSTLSGAQQESLRPLSATWDTLGDGHKRKWIALAKNYTAMAPAEQAKLHSRMAEWAALNPRERELARINFVETKKLSPSDRASDWEAYKALSPEERRKLAKKAVVAPKGAAATIKPVPADKLAAVPVTRHTTQIEREMANSKQSIDRNTLLPLPPRALPSVSVPQN